MINKTILTLLLAPVIAAGQTPLPQPPMESDPAPAELLGQFEDDYGENYSITQTQWSGPGSSTMEIARWDNQSNSLLLRNDPNDPNYSGMWTRIDWLQLPGMSPYKWAYCFTVFDATSLEEAEASAPADRENPRVGCGGFPFSRMKKL